MFRVRDVQSDALRCAQTARIMCAALKQKGETPTFDSRERLIHSTDAAGHTWRYQLAAPGKLESIVTPTGRVSKMSFDDRGRIEEAIEPSGRHTQIPCDEQGAPRRFVRNGTEFVRFSWDVSRTSCSAEFWDGSQARLTTTQSGKPLRYTNRLNHVTRLDYGKAGHLVALRDARGQVTAFERDELDRPSTTRHPDGRVESLNYIAIDTVAVSAGSEPIVEMQVDSRRQPIAATYGDGQAYSFSYDDGGHLTTAEGPEGACVYEYREDGKLTSETCGDQTFQFEYDARGLLAVMHYPDGTRADFSYDPDRRLERATWGDAIFNFAYDPRDAGRSVTTPQFRTQVDFDPFGKAARIEVTDTTTQRTVFDTTYRHDTQGRVVSKRDSSFGERRFSYDAESQLLGVADERGQWSETFSYDAAGNRTSTGGINVELSPGNRLLRQGDAQCEYDSRGNVVVLQAHGEIWRFVYDLKNQMLEAHGPLGRTEFKYDAFGRRIEKRTGERCTRYVWCGEKLTREIITTHEGVSVRDFLYYPGSYEPLALRVDGRIYYYHNDHLATPQRLTDEQGQVVWAAEYYAFGFASVSVELTENPLRLPGQYADVETGLHYNRFRYYSPLIGRYLSVDPVGLLGGHNLYLYANNNPINDTDPMGLFSWGALGAAVVGAAAAAALVIAAPAIATVAVVAIGALALGAVIGVGIMEAQSIDKFCWPCFWEGAAEAAPEAFAIGLGIGILTALCAPLGAALIVGGAIYGTYSLFDAHFGWSGGTPFDQMTDEEKSKHVGGLFGGTVAGTVGGLVGGLGAGAVRGIVRGRGGGTRTAPAEEVAPAARRDPPGTHRDANGRLRNEDGTFANDPNATGSRRPTRRATKEEQDNGGAELDPNAPETRATIEERNQAIAERDAARARGDDEAAGAAQHRANQATSRLGEQATDETVAAKYPESETVHEGTGQGTFDRVYKNNSPPPEYIIAEAKGGSASNSSSRAGPNGERYQQGTPEYRDSVIDEMSRSPNQNERTLAENLRNTDPADIDYIEVKQPLDSNGNPKPIKVSKYGDSVPAESTEE